MRDEGPLKTLIMRIASPEVLTEIVAILIAALIGIAATQLLRAWQKRSGITPEHTGWRARLLEGIVLLAPFLVAMVVILLVRGVLGSMSMHTAVVDTALQLVTALLLVRFGLFLLRLWLGAETWLRTWESRVTFIVWLLLAFQLLGWFDYIESTLDRIDLIPGKAQFSLWSLLKGIVVIAGFLVVTSLIARAIERRVMKLEGLAISIRIGISKFSTFALLALGVLLGINASGVDLTALTVLTGAIGIGLGFGLQTIASNFVSGFVLLMDKSIKPGDVISFTGTTGTSSENFGWVQELRGRYIVVRDRDGVETLVPNQNLMTNSVINWSYSDQRVRIRLPVHISFQDDPEVALQVLVDAAANHPRILKDPGPVSRLMSFENFGMRVEVRFWIRDPMNGVNNVRSDVNREIWRLFKKHGITIPVQQHDIRVVTPEIEPPPGLRR